LNRTLTESMSLEHTTKPFFS